MSLQTWKDEFYSPLNADIVESMSDLDAVNHALKKWDGLLHLDEHGVEIHGSWVKVLVDENLEKFDISADTCSLCHKFNDCDDCPLSQSRDGKSCDQIRIDEADSPWNTFKETNDPKPMIMWLKKAKEDLENVSSPE